MGYFRDEWIDAHPNWYYRVIQHRQAQSMLKSREINILKVEKTHRDQFPLSRFIPNQYVTWLKERSSEYVVGSKKL